MLSIPNFLVCAGILGAIAYTQHIYGHVYNNPYVQMMVMFSLVNVLILGGVVVIGQEKFIEWVRHNILHAAILQPVLQPLRMTIWRTRHGLYDGIRYVAIVITIAAAAVSTGFLVFGYKPYLSIPGKSDIPLVQKFLPKTNTSAEKTTAYKNTLSTRIR